MEYLLALDPGKATGCGIVNLNNPLGESEFAELEFMEFNGILEYWSLLAADEGVVLHIVSERFVIMQDTVKKSRTDTNWSIETIGVARYFAHRDGHGFDLQGATEAKKLGSDKLLKRFGWWHKSDHARDAARHAALYIARTKSELFNEMLRTTE